MNYDSVLIELLGRVQELERQMKELKERVAVETTDEMSEKITTEDIFDYVIRQKERAKECGEEKIILRAGDVERAVGLKNRITMVVNAMKKAMTDGDSIISSTPSGFSTTFEIEYCLSDRIEEVKMSFAENKFIIRKAVSPKTMREINELKVQAGREYIMAFDREQRCIGVVFEHYEKRGSVANGQAEICFFDEYFNKYGKWHRMFLGGKRGERLMFERLQKQVIEFSSYEYMADITLR